MRTVKTWKRQFSCLLAVGVIACLSSSLQSETGATTASGQAESQQEAPVAKQRDGKPKDRKQLALVELTIDYGDGMQRRFPVLKWRDGLTVFATLQEADRHPRGISMVSRGRGATRIVTQIDDLKNGGAGAKKNWIFRVNGELAHRSCGVFKLKPGDRVLWKFEQYQ